MFLPDDNFLILTEDVSVTDVTAADIGDSTIAIDAAAAISALVLLPGEERILPPLRFFPTKKEKEKKIEKKIEKKRKLNGKSKEYIMRINDKK